MNLLDIRLLRIQIIAMAGACLALAGCNAGGPITVNSVYGPGIKFSGLGPTYAWAPDSFHQKVASLPMLEMIHQSVEKHLAAKGFTLSQGEKVDFYIDYRVARREEDYSGVVAHGETIEIGSLILAVFDPTSRQMIWRGVARAQILDSDSPELRKNRMEAAMRGLMEKFPRKA